MCWVKIELKKSKVKELSVCNHSCIFSLCWMKNEYMPYTHCFINFLSEVTTGIFLCFFFYLFWGQLHFLSYFTIIFPFCGFPCVSAGKESTCGVGLIPGLGRSPGEVSESLPTPVFWPREFHGLYNPWGYKELDTTEQTS